MTTSCRKEAYLDPPFNNPQPKGIFINSRSDVKKTNNNSYNKRYGNDMRYRGQISRTNIFKTIVSLLDRARMVSDQNCDITDLDADELQYFTVLE